MIAFTIHDIGFTQSSISPRFTDGTHLDAVIANLRAGRVNPDAFPPLQIFTITDPWDKSVHTYSLSNRRLYVFRKANVDDFPHAAASLADVVACTWQFTNVTEDFPVVDVNPRKDVDIYSDTLLIRFRRDVESWASALELNWHPSNEDTWQDRLRDYVMGRYNFRHTPP
ncbi:hypothetical protein [Polyangium sp. 6x1]|uniref:hypothetical protein n=1 Tax=Polyangium sp. 6x1 TaxID=3042689 RepID=UPI002482C008|nr:hypothetical protein [Polyangium sp. 6x1]MDI1443066.1 hypothetical protein [Polyangium sp. 6x1]